MGNVDWPSSVNTISSLASIVGWTRTVDVPGMTMGRLVRVCGAMGVMIIASTFGWTIGPPAERL